MKKITLLLALLISSIGFSQTVVEDFEGSAPTLKLNDGFGAATIEADPVVGGTRGNVLKLVTSASGKSWQGTNLILQGNVLDLSTTNKIVTADVYSTSAFTMLGKVESPEGSGAASAAEAAHTGNGWESLSFDFSRADDNTPAAADVYGSISFFPLRKAGGWEDPSVTTTYVDNISGIAVAPSETCSDGIMNQDETGIDCGGTCSACPVPPTTAPTAPPSRNAWDVISLYSEAYTSTGLNGVDWDNGADAVEETIAGNKVLKITAGNFIGFELPAGVDATDMTHFHMDYWVAVDFAAGQVFNPKLSNHEKADATAGESESKLYTIALAAADVKVWKSFDGTLDDFKRGNILQLLITDSGTISSSYIDNVYMYRAATAGVSDNAALNVSMYPNPASGVLNISAANTIEDASIYNVLGTKVMSLNIDSNSEAIDVSGLSSGIYLIKYTIGDAVGTAKFIKE